MNLLLLLSALLSALTGIVPGRSAQACAVVEQHRGEAVQRCAAASPVTRRPAQAWVHLVDAAAAPLATAITAYRSRIILAYRSRIILLTRRRRE